MRAQHATRCCREAASSAGQSAHSADRSQVAISFYHYHFGLSLRHSPITVTSSIELQANTLRREWQRLTLCVLVSLGSVRRACGPVHTRRHISAPSPSHTHINRRTHAHTRCPTDSTGGRHPPPLICAAAVHMPRGARPACRVSGVHAAHHSLAHATRHASAARRGHGTCARMLPSAVPQHRWHP